MSVVKGAILALTALLVASGCGDPVRSNARDALGPETSVPRGPLHRAGQPCLVCHDGSTAPDFAVAGTLYVSSTSKVPLVDGVVNLTDATGAARSVAANCAGNFYLPSGEYSPVYPLSVTVQYGAATRPMISRIHRDGACAACHTDPPGPASAGHVYLDDVSPPTPRVCP